jgi:hypothetical protein
MNLIVNQALKTVIENSVIPSLEKEINSLKSKNRILIYALGEFEDYSCDGSKYIHACHICYDVGVEDAYDCDLCETHFGYQCCSMYCCYKCDIFLCDNCNTKSYDDCIKYISNNMTKDCDECIKYYVSEESSEELSEEESLSEEHNQNYGVSEEFMIKAGISPQSDIISEVNKVDNK